MPFLLKTGFISKLYGNIFVFSTPVSLEIDTVHVDIWVLASLQRTVAPGFDVDVGLLVQLADGGRGHLASPQSFCDVLHTAHGHTHLDEGFLNAAADQFLDLRLDNFLVELYNVVGDGLLSPFECLCRNFILPEICKPCLFLSIF